VDQPSNTLTNSAKTALGLARVGLGFVFLWAFLDKTFGLGFRTGRTTLDDGHEVVDYFGDAAWINGGSPTKGFLSFGTKGPFADIFQDMAGLWWADWLFMLGLLGIGLGLTLGIAMKLSAWSGAVLLVLMYLAEPVWAGPMGNNPIIDDHIIYALVALALAYANAGNFIGFGRQWNDRRVLRTSVLDN
jgi:thiosulfate dehydrogenase [quinone] large subunit